MNTHQNARTTPHIRALMIASYRSGDRVSAIAERFAVSPNTVYKWIRRHREAGDAGLIGRASTPRHVRQALDPSWLGLVIWLRRELRMTSKEIAIRLNIARSTVARWLKALGMGRLNSLVPRPPVRRYQRERPGEMIHLDIKKLGKFNRIGHRITGDRRKGRSCGAGWECVHVAIDDATRVAYVEVLPDEKKWTAVGFLIRAVRWFRKRGINVERVMTDNGSCYKAHTFARTCRRLNARHITTRPYRPQTNGKAERFIQTLLREWAYGNVYRSSQARAADLPRWLDWYNTVRSHSAINNLAPAQALNNALRFHT